MTTKLEQAARQALEALESCNVGNWSMAFDEFAVVEAITALREALEHSGKANEFEPDWDGTLGLVEEIKRLAIENERLRHGEIKYEDWEFNPMTGESLLVENHGQKPAAWMNEVNGFICKEKTRSYHVPLYTRPVRTVDLTDDEIMKINVDTASIVPTCDRQFHFARAVIAADREKNNV